MRVITLPLIRLIEERKSFLDGSPRMTTGRASPSPSVRNSPAPSSTGSSYRPGSALSTRSRRSATFELPPAPNLHRMRLRSGRGGVEGGGADFGGETGTPNAYSLRGRKSNLDISTQSTMSHRESSSIRRRKTEYFTVQERLETSLQSSSTMSSAVASSSSSIEAQTSQKSHLSRSIVDARRTSNVSAVDVSLAASVDEESFRNLSFDDDDVDESLLIPDLPPELPPPPPTPPFLDLSVDTPDRLAMPPPGVFSPAILVAPSLPVHQRNAMMEERAFGGVTAAVGRLAQADGALLASSSSQRRPAGAVIKKRTLKRLLKSAAGRSHFCGLLDEWAYNITTFVSAVERRLCSRPMKNRTMAFTVITFLVLLFGAVRWCQDPSRPRFLALPSSPFSESLHSVTPWLPTWPSKFDLTGESSVSTDVHKSSAEDGNGGESRWNFFRTFFEMGSSLFQASGILLGGAWKLASSAVNVTMSTTSNYMRSPDPPAPARRDSPQLPAAPLPLPKRPCDCPSASILLAELKNSPEWPNTKSSPTSCTPCSDPATQAHLEVLSRRIDELNAQLVAVAANQSSSRNSILDEAKKAAEASGKEEAERIWDSMRKIEAQLVKVKAEQDQLREELTRVVRENVDVTLRQVVAAFQQPPSNEASDVFSSPAFGFATWLRSELDHDGETRGLYLETRLKEYINSTFASAVSAGGSDKKAEQTENTEGKALGLDLDLVAKIVKEQIVLYDADKTGKPDFALESSGGAIVSTRCTEEYSQGFAEYYFMGIPVWWRKTSPRNAIQPRVSPGECWAFKGDQGYLVIQLATPIYVTGFTVEHIPKSIAITGDIKSAPKDFVIYGLNGERDPNPVEFGSFTYDHDGEPVQYFPVQNQPDAPYAFVELNVRSNWGNPNYTCLYRIRVHGTRP